MAQRRFGPTQGAGVAVIEKDADKPIEPATLGVTAYFGVMERGPTDKLFLASKKTDYLARAGSYIPESLLPDAAFDFYNLSQGAGELWLKRITDGTERKAELVLKNRRFPHGDVLKITADNGGRWAGKKSVLADDYVSVTQTTLTTGKTVLKNEFKGALLRLSAVPGKSYKVISNTTSGVFTFASDTTLVTDINGSVNQLYSIELTNDGKEVSVLVKEGELNPTTEFGLEVYDNGVLVKNYPDLSMDPDSARYVVRTINDDGGNFWIKVQDLNIGSITADIRPANFHGKVKTISALQLTADIHELLKVGVVVGTVVPALTAVTYGGSVKKDRLILTCTTASPGAAVFSVVSDLQGALANATQGTAYVGNEYGLNFTLGNTGSGEYTVGDILHILVDPFPVNGFAGFTVIPDYVNNRRTKFVIASNTANAITVKAGSDMTTVTAVNDEFLVQAALGLAKGYDGIEDIVDSTYTIALDPGTTQLKSLFGKNKGLVKLGIPGVTSTAVQKAGLALAEAMNYQFRVEIPSNIVTEQAAEEYINSTIGRNDFGKVHFPSYAFVSNPLGAGNKLVTLTGAIHGREAKIARDFQGYHKVAGGIDVTLPNVIKLPDGLQDKVLNEEFLNPVGINVIKFYKGNAILWGARTIALDPAFKFVQHREQLSYYENIFRENFDYIIFAINDVAAQERLKASFVSFFLPEFAKGAIRGNTFEDAVRIKIDDENNTDLTRAAGDLNAEITVRLADTVERFIITIGKAGIFENLAA